MVIYRQDLNMNTSKQEKSKIYFFLFNILYVKNNIPAKTKIISIRTTSFIVVAFVTFNTNKNILLICKISPLKRLTTQFSDDENTLNKLCLEVMSMALINAIKVY